MASGEMDLQKMLCGLKPILHDGIYVFTSVEFQAVKDGRVKLPERDEVLMEMREKEGLTLVLEQAVADKHGIEYNYEAAWIQLEVHSSLEAVGLTAAFSKALGKEGVSANVVAGYYHDHIFVAHKDSGKACRILEALAEESRLELEKAAS
eukprot:TRINITY_DN84054_c0_g1_i1.p1 TRINITY_DN84054_c0_g1~~TRINITY_DN84054_c0_g1_i1.p1  ORF type:complete len:150 (+),score=43.82 TRINITY_DN84054_c0_g1_i1:51-500(+)